MPPGLSQAIRLPPAAARAAAVRAASAVCAVTLAVAAAHALDLDDAWWAAITAFVVPDASFRASISRGVLRMLGTLAGAVLGVLLCRVLHLDGPLFVALMAGSTWAGLYMAHTRPHSYAWVLGIVTFVMVMCEAWTTRAGLPRDLFQFAMERCANVAVGIVASLLVEGAVLLWRQGPAGAGAVAASRAPHRVAALHALQGAIAVGLFALVLWLHPMPAFAQAMVTALAVLIVPLGADAQVAQDAHPQVRRRMLLRVAGCAVAALLAALLLPLLQGLHAACLLALALGVGAGAWVQNSVPAWRYAAIQFTVAFMMVFVQDRGWIVHPQAALGRLAGMAAGVGLMLLVTTAWARAARRR